MQEPGVEMGDLLAAARLPVLREDGGVGVQKRCKTGGLRPLLQCPQGR